MLRSLGLALLLFCTIRFFLLQTFVITSGSMKDTLLVGDYLVANRAIFGARIPGSTMHLPGYAEPQRLDVVVFDPHHDIDEKLVKRIVGMPGDTLEMVGGQLHRNGEPQSEPYVKRDPSMTHGTDPAMVWQLNHLLDSVDADSYAPTPDDWGPLVVPLGHFFLLGDNRDASYDSRHWGPLAEWRVEARVSFVYYSYDADALEPFPFLTEIRWSRIANGIG